MVLLWLFLVFFDNRSVFILILYIRYIIDYRINCLNCYNSLDSYDANFLINLASFNEISLTTSSAYLLVIHGSRNRKTYDAALKLKQLLTTQLQSKNILTQQNYLDSSRSSLESKITDRKERRNTPLIDVAALELAPLSLSESLVKFARQAHRQGIERVKVLPLFLIPGVHVKVDIPTEIESAIAKIGNRTVIELSPYLGKYSGMIQLLNQKFAGLPAQARIIVSHGSRMPQVSDYYQNLATQLDAVMAYWSVEPSLSQQVEAQIAAGHKRIAILPYFLFPGKITEAIAKEVSELQTKYPEVESILGQPLGATPVLAELIAQEC